ncbi:MAG: NAD(P)-dependent oxidoreductase, partial [Roseiarcus sp.]
VAALDAGVLKGASLDVFETEPLPASSPLWTHPNVYVSPHNSAISSPEAIARYIVEQILAFERGEPLRNVVDRARGSESGTLPRAAIEASERGADPKSMPTPANS